jgi:excisionase family DNA binding protein
MTDRLLTVVEVADILRLKPATVRSLVNRHGSGLVAARVGGRLRFRQADIDAYLEAQKVVPPPPAPLRRASMRVPARAPRVARSGGSPATESIRERIRRKRQEGR